MERIPESICDLENLSYLWVFNNNIDSLPDCFCSLNLDWVNTDNGGYPFFAIGANNLCSNIPSCIEDSEHLELSLDQFYYSFPVYSPQECDSSVTKIDDQILPYQFTTSSAYPNPFNPSVNIDIMVPYDRPMTLSILDLKGKEIEVISKNKIYRKGKNKITWHSKSHPSGIYFIKIQDNFRNVIKKIILLK